jgi:hypothetical protein
VSCYAGLTLERDIRPEPYAETPPCILQSAAFCILQFARWPAHTED